MNKGAMLFPMLRGQMGDLGFKSVLHGFYAKCQGKTATIRDFENMAIATANAGVKPGQEAPNLQGHFAQWLNSTGVPEFSLEDVVYRTRKGFRIVGKIRQALDTFSMTVLLGGDPAG